VPDDVTPVPDSGQYGRSFADVYDEWYHAVPPTDVVAFLAARLPPGASVLELGVGTGRIALPLAAAGFSVTGLDSSPEMLEQLAAKAAAESITVIAGDAGDPSVYPRGNFDAVLAVFNLLFNLADLDAQQRCLGAAAGALGTDGLVVVEAFVPRRITERELELVTRSVEPHRVVLIATDADPLTQRIVGNHIELTDGNVRLRPWTIRASSPDEIDAMATRAGLVCVERFESFAGDPWVPGESAHHVSIYKRA